MTARSFALGVMLAAGVGAGVTPADATDGGPWSAPAALGSCTANGRPQVIFPSNRPNHATGPGAIVWSASTGCAGGAGVRVAALGAGDIPTTAAIPTTTGGRQLAPRGSISASDAPHGKIVIAGRSARAPGETLVIQGTANGPFSQLAHIPHDPVPPALASAYLGDVALAFPTPSGADGKDLNVSVERYFAHQLTPRGAVNSWTGGSAGSVTVALDYRTDALTVWTHAGSLWAHDLPASGTRQPLQRLASVKPGVRVVALLSDDNRATVAWAQESAGISSVYLERSAVGVRFGRPKLLERFRNPDGLPDPPGSPQLVRLSSESVMMAWAGSAAGHWVVRTAAIDFAGLRAVTTLAAPGADALLADLAPGPRNNAVLLWTEPRQSPTGAPELRRQVLLSARGSDISADAIAFGAPEQVAPPGPYSNPTVALDPANDSAVAAWQGEGGTLQYAVRAPPGSAP